MTSSFSATERNVDNAPRRTKYTSFFNIFWFWIFFRKVKIIICIYKPLVEDTIMVTVVSLQKTCLYTNALRNISLHVYDFISLGKFKNFVRRRYKLTKNILSL